MEDHNEKGDSSEEDVQDLNSQGDNEPYTDEEFDSLLDGDDSDDDSEEDGNDSEEDAEEDSDDETEDDPDDEDDSQAPDEDEQKLNSINDVFGTNYRSLDEAKKAQKKKKTLAKKSEKSPDVSDASIDNKMAMRFLRMEHPEATHVMDQLEKESARSGENVLDIFESSVFLQKEAKAIDEDEGINTSNKKKIKRPNSGAVRSKSVDFGRMSDKQFQEYRNKRGV